MKIDADGSDSGSGMGEWCECFTDAEDAFEWNNISAI